MKLKTEIEKIKGDWPEVMNDCRFTVGKEPLDKEPSDKFKRRILIAEHSPIRDIHIKWIWRAMPHWITVHWVRHKFEKFVRTQRVDRTGSTIPRNEHKQGEPQDLKGDANIQQLIDSWRKRLCWQASAETREYAEDFKFKLHEILPNVADSLVPNCVYRCGCPEMSACPYYKKHKQSYYDHLLEQSCGFVRAEDIQTRYDNYNKIFRKEFEEEYIDD